MRNTAGVFLFLTFSIIVRSLKKDPGEFRFFWCFKVVHYSQFQM